MSTLQHFEVVGIRAFFRPTGRMSLDDGVELVVRALIAAREAGARDLVVDITGVSGLLVPTVFERYSLVKRFAVAAAGQVRMAMAVDPNLLDPARFGETVAANRSLIARAVATEAEAVAWLDSLPGRPAS
jgi:hypothetical protein